MRIPIDYDGNPIPSRTGLEHYVSASGGQILVDGLPKPVKIISDYTIQIGCTKVDISAITRLYNLLKMTGYIS